MKKLNGKKSIIIVTLLAVLFITSNVYATGTVSPINIITTTQTTNEVTTNQTTNETTTTNTLTTPAPTQQPTTNTQGSTYTNTNLPQTGDASDYAVFLLIAVSIIIAIVAYKKVRDYNI